MDPPKEAEKESENESKKEPAEEPSKDVEKEPFYMDTKRMVPSGHKTWAEEAAEKKAPYEEGLRPVEASSHAAQSEASDSIINLVDVSEEPPTKKPRYEKERGGQWIMLQVPWVLRQHFEVLSGGYPRSFDCRCGGELVEGRQEGQAGLLE